MTTIDLAALYWQVKSHMGGTAFNIDLELWDHGRGPQLEVSIYDSGANQHYAGPTAADAYRQFEISRSPKVVPILPEVVLP